MELEQKRDKVIKEIGERVWLCLKEAVRKDVSTPLKFIEKFTAAEQLKSDSLHNIAIRTAAKTHSYDFKTNKV